MELDVSRLAAEGMRLVLDGAEGERRLIVLAPSAGVSGRYRIDPKAHYIDATAEEQLSISEIRWPAGPTQVDVGGALFDRAAVDIKIKRGKTTGQIGAKKLTLDKLSLRLEGLAAPIVLRKVMLDRPGLALGDDALALVCQTASIERVDLVVGGLKVVLHKVDIRGLRLRRGQGVWLILAKRLNARRISVAQGDVSLIAEGVEAQTVALDGKVIRVARLAAPKAHLSGARLSNRRERSGDSVTPSTAERPAFDWSFLDGLDGKVDVDLTVDADLPVFGNRRATHHFRLAVDSGTINYHRLEKSLSSLEDAVLDFRVRGNDLVLERDIPLMTKVLVSWPLESRDMALAERQLVRIGRLLDYRIPTQADADPDKKSSFELREVGLGGLNIELGLAGGGVAVLPGGGRIELGEDGRPALDELTVRGSLRYVPDTAERAKLDVSLAMLNIGVTSVPVGTRHLSIAAIGLGSLDKGSVRFVGMRPDGVDATLRDLEILSLRLVP